MLQSYNSENRVNRGLAALVAASLLALSGTAMADSGFYAGGSVGNTTLEVNFEDPIEGGNFTFDESDFSWKVFGGFNFDLPVINLGVEGGYSWDSGEGALPQNQQTGGDEECMSLRQARRYRFHGSVFRSRYWLRSRLPHSMGSPG